MYIVSPLSRCASMEKRDQFFKYIADIAPVTYEIEPDCLGYAWFRSTENNGTVPLHWCRGFEIYNSPEASRVTHRASEQYKTFRSAVGREALLESPSDLEFWQSTDIGFLTKGEQVKFSPREESDQLQCVVTDELAVASTSKKQLLDQLRKIAEIARLESDVLTFWVLDRDSAESSAASTENNVYVFMRFSSEAAWKAYGDVNLPTEWEMVRNLATNRRTTTWEEAGIGFLGR